MKKVLVGVSILLVTMVIFGAGFIFAQSQSVSAAGLPQGFGPGGMMGGRGGQGQMHEYIEQALADKLGMTKDALEAEQAKGKSLYQIVIDKGIKESDATTLLTEVHKTAFAKAVTDGVLTQAQADAMLQNMSTNGFNIGNCPMQNGQAGGRGMRNGRGNGGMMGGGWAQQGVPTVAP